VNYPKNGDFSRNGATIATKFKYFEDIDETYPANPELNCLLLSDFTSRSLRSSRETAFFRIIHIFCLISHKAKCRNLCKGGTYGYEPGD